MKIPLFYIPKTKYKYFLEVKRRYTYSKYIIPIGRDCHAAHSLQVLGLRPQSLPYDWIRLKAQVGLQIVRDNIAERFEFFLHNLKKNEEGNTYSEKYPNAEFTHAKAVLEDEKLRNTFKKRAQRLLQIVDTQPVAFLHILEIHTFTHEDIAPFVASVKKFRDILKPEDSLHIYIRYDKVLENQEIANILIEKIGDLPQVFITTYNRDKDTYGIWGNPRKYVQLYADLRIKLKLKAPLIRIIS